MEYRKKTQESQYFLLIFVNSAIQAFFKSVQTSFHALNDPKNLLPLIGTKAFQHGSKEHFKVDLAPTDILFALLGKVDTDAAAVLSIPDALYKARSFQPPKRHADACTAESHSFCQLILGRRVHTPDLKEELGLSGIKSVFSKGALHAHIIAVQKRLKAVSEVSGQLFVGHIAGDAVWIHKKHPQKE